VALPAGSRGRGGRNLDLACRLAMRIAGRGDVAVIAAGTDGRDGSSAAAGAVVDGATAGRAGSPLAAALAAFDTEPALAATGDLVVTGPTGTNVGDLVVAVRAPA
jgi:hydroxypyruvate reductase